MIRLDAARLKTGYGRTITLIESPSAVSLLAAMKLRSNGSSLVFDGLTDDGIRKAAGRLVRHYGAPADFCWQALRRTCCAVLTCAPGIYRGASAFMSAARAGHGVQVAQNHYVGLMPSLPKTAETIEQALGIDDLARAIVAAASGNAVDIAVVAADAATA